MCDLLFVLKDDFGGVEENGKRKADDSGNEQDTVINRIRAGNQKNTFCDAVKCKAGYGKSKEGGREAFGTGNFGKNGKQEIRRSGDQKRKKRIGHVVAGNAVAVRGIHDTKQKNEQRKAAIPKKCAESFFRSRQAERHIRPPLCAYTW